MTFYIILQTCVITRWLVENRSLTVSVAASVKVWDYLVSLVLIRVWEWCDRSVCVCHSGNLSVLAPPHGKHQARTAWQTGAGSLPPAGARPVCHHLYGDITSTSTMLCSALVPLTWPPTGSHFYCHITIILTLWMLYLCYLCISTVTCFVLCWSLDENVCFSCWLSYCIVLCMMYLRRCEVHSGLHPGCRHWAVTTLQLYWFIVPLECL